MKYPLLVDDRLILSFEEFDPVRSHTYQKLRQKAKEGSWCFAPPIVVSPMPSEYQGRFSHFLYNGHGRLLVAREFNVPLMGLIVEREEDIPLSELTGEFSVDGKLVAIDTLEERLRYILTSKVQPYSIAVEDRNCYDFSYLVQEFMKWEQGRQKEYR